MIDCIAPSTLKQSLHDGQEIAVLDVREHGQYGEAHLFYGTPLPFSRLDVDVARLVPRRDVRVVVYDSGEADTAGVAARAAARLIALGYSQVRVLEGGTQGWKAAGYELFAGVNLPSKTFGELAEHAYGTPRITASELADRLARNDQLVVLDGRPVNEFHKMSIPTATCCPNGELAYRVRTLVPDDSTPIVINCAGRTRSIIGAQTLINLGIPNPVYALENGTQGWYLADHQLVHGSKEAFAANTGSTALKASAEQLARRFDVPTVSAATVADWAQDHSRSLFLCDVRTPEEFATGSLPGAQHTPGGQLMQAGDQYVGVRGARLVLVDDDGVRAPTVASWLRQMGHDASVLEGGLQAGRAAGLAVHALALDAVAPALPTIDATTLAARLAQGTVVVIDLRAGMQYRAGHIAQAQWGIRPRLAAQVQQQVQQQFKGQPGTVVLVADEPAVAHSAALELPAGSDVVLLDGGMAAWQAAGFATTPSADEPNDVECIDYLFFVHDRHDGNKDAARRYLAWETGLVAQLDVQELAAFHLPHHTTPQDTTQHDTTASV